MHLNPLIATVDGTVLSTAIARQVILMDSRSAAIMAMYIATIYYLSTYSNKLATNLENPLQICGRYSNASEDLSLWPH